MLRDRYDPVDLFTPLPGLCLQFESVLAELDQLLEDDALFQQVKAEFSRRRPHPLTRGRSSTPVEVLLRMLVVMRLYHGSYEQTQYWVNDSLVLRQFCRVYTPPVPDDTPLYEGYWMVFGTRHAGEWNFTDRIGTYSIDIGPEELQGDEAPLLAQISSPPGLR
ncbi:MAG: hypothetical protein C4321_03450 [Chloroflexota bacterium]